MITQKQAYKNIKAIFLGASDTATIGGNAWYRDAHEFCVTLAAEYDLELSVTVAALAVLSPNCSWAVNKACLESLLKTGNPTGNVYPDNVKKAEALLSGALSVQQALFFRKQYGNKVRSFYDNILNPEHSNNVTVDTHAIRGAFDSTAVTRKQLRWVFETITGYNTLVTAYQQVAEEVGLVPNQVQATVWLAVKEELAKGGA